MSKDYKLDIFQVLRKIDSKDRKFFDSLSEDELKGFLPFLIMRWMSGTSDPMQVYMLNELVNPYVFSFSDNKELLYYLLTTVSDDKRIKRYSWIKGPTANKKSSMPEALSVIKEYFGYNNKEAEDALNILSDEDIIDYASQLGKQKEEISKLSKELKKK